MKHSTLSLLICIGGCFSACSPTNEKVNPLTQHEDEITNIIAEMTLEEKINMLHGKNMFSSAGVERLNIPDIEYADGPFGIREEMEPHSWNSLHLSTDSATFFPTGSALAATWSTEMAYKYGEGMAAEAKLRGKDMILGPAINIQRIPTGGRTYEDLSEDPLLSGELAVNYTLGAQDHQEAVCLKHYALNNQENMRGFVDVKVSERAMREIYLAPFEAAVKKANAYGVMAAYNKVSGEWCSENDRLLNKILRGEWGFKGIVISDWGGTHSTTKAALGGLDVEMPNDRYFGKALLDSVQAGVVSEKVIDEKVRNLLRVRLAIPAVPKEEANTQMTSLPAQQQIAYEVASRSIVLLKNSGLLPINTEKVKDIAVIGDNAVRHMATGGVGAGVKALYEITPLEGLQKAYEGTNVKIKYAQGYLPQERSSRHKRNSNETASSEKEIREKSERLVQEAIALAKEADLVIFVGGNNREVETEGSDRKNITLPSHQDELIQSIAKANPNIVSVMVIGGPVDLQTIEKNSSSILVSWFNGSEGGHALADVLSGKISPSGKLPFTFPIKLEDSPAYHLGVYPQQQPERPRDVFVDLVNRDKFRAEQKAEADYAEDIFVGYRWYATKNISPLYPFGHGLSYANFQYSALQAKINKSQVDVSFTLDNIGKMNAEEVAQVYITRPQSAIERPAHELKGFQRVALKAGESKEITISIPLEQLCHWDEKKHGWTFEEGPAIIRVGSSSENLPLNTEINLINVYKPQ